MGNQKIVGAHGIANIRPGAEGGKISRSHHRCLLARLDHRDLLGKAGLGEDVPTTGPGMCEHTRGHDLHSIGLSIKTANQVGAGFRDGIRRGGMKGALLADGQFVPRHPAKDLGGGADMDYRGNGFNSADGLKQTGSPQNVDVQSLDGSLEAGGGVTLCG